MISDEQKDDLGRKRKHIENNFKYFYFETIFVHNYGNGFTGSVCHKNYNRIRKNIGDLSVF